MRDSHPWRELLIWEAISRAYEAYMARHRRPQTTRRSSGPGCDLDRQYLGEGAGKVSGTSELLKEAWGKRWTPFLESPPAFPDDSALVLQYEDIVDGHDGQIDPKLNRAIDPRCALAARIILGMDHREPDRHFIIYGRDILERSPESEVPRGHESW